MTPDSSAHPLSSSLSTSFEAAGIVTSDVCTTGRALVRLAGPSSPSPRMRSTSRRRVFMGAGSVASVTCSEGVYVVCRGVYVVKGLAAISSWSCPQGKNTEPGRRTKDAMVW